MVVDRYSSLPHYAEHIAPIWTELERRGLAGESWAPRHGCWWGKPMGRRDLARPVLVAGLGDHQRVNPSPTILVEHGAGQAYVDLASGSYSGGPGWERARLFVCPNETVAGRWRATYPETPAAVVGAPKMDRWHAGLRGRGETGDRGRSTTPGHGGSTRTRNRETARISAYESLEGRSTGTTATVAITFHWECRLVPETRSAWEHYDRALPDLVAWADRNGIRLLGHGHPRLWGRIERRWTRLGVEPVERLDDVLDRADLLVADNTSALFEFASTDRPVVVLNAPWYRRDVEHGGRFWTWADVGVQVDRPEELPGAIAVALADPPSIERRRAEIVGEVYHRRDGRAALRAADAIEEVLADA